MAGTRYRTQKRDWHGRWKAETGGARKGTRKITRKLSDMRDKIGTTRGINFGHPEDYNKKPGLLHRIGSAVKRVAKKVVGKLKGEDIEFFLANGAFFMENGDLMVPTDVLGEWEAEEGIMLSEGREIVIENLDDLLADGVQVEWEDEEGEMEGETVVEDLEELIAAGVGVYVEDEDGELLELTVEDVQAVYELID